MDISNQLKRGFRRTWFYMRSFAIYYMPKVIRRKIGKRTLRSLTDEECAILQKRVDYYVKCTEFQQPQILPCRISDYRYPYGQKQKFGTYFLDLYRSLSCFPIHLRFAYLFGDITETFGVPTIVKSRPIGSVSNSVLLKLNSERHFQWVKDSIAFRGKKDLIVFRNIVNQPMRALLLEKFWQHPMCDFGMTGTIYYKEHPEWYKTFMSKKEQLEFKFIMCIEGHDVATNLKWVMSSHSVAVMPRPKYETWFMEGTLKPNYHYIEIAEDYSDLIERVQYYIQHPEEAETIITHANEYVKQFQNNRLEFTAELLTLQRYFLRTNQIPES